MELISKDTIKELFNKLIQLNTSKFEFIYNAKQNTFGYADIKELYYKGNSIFIASQSEMLKFQEYRLNLEMDLMGNESSKDLPIKKEDIEYINNLKARVYQIKELENDELLGITDEGELLYDVELYKKLQDIYFDITEERIIEK